MDLPTYPVLFASYVQAYLRASESLEELNELKIGLLKVMVLLLVLITNVFGARVIALSSMALAIFVLAPFFFEPLALSSLSSVHIEAWKSIAPDIHWSVFLSTVLWNYQGWDSLGCLAGEVHDAKRSYPLAIVIALVLITLNYLVPGKSVGWSVQHDIE